MKVQLTKDSIDLGIVVKDIDAALAFYRDTLGFTPAGELRMPTGSHMWRLMCGTAAVKLIKHEKEPAAAAPGGISGATGYRYFTVSVSNIEEVVQSCKDGGYKVIAPISEFLPGVTIAIIADPEGNWVELLQGP